MGTSWQQAGPADAWPRPVLYLPAGAEAAGFLWFELPDGQIGCCTRIRGVLARLLIAMHDAMQADAHVPWPARGWRSAEKLAQAIGEAGVGVEIETIRKYLSQLQKSVRNAFENAGKADKVPLLVERRRGLGARLGTARLKIIDRNATGPSERCDE